MIRTQDFEKIVTETMSRLIRKHGVIVNVRLLYSEIVGDIIAKCYDILYEMKKDDVSIDEIIKYLDANKFAYAYENEIYNAAQIKLTEGM